MTDMLKKPLPLHEPTTSVKMIKEFTLDCSKALTGVFVRAVVTFSFQFRCEVANIKSLTVLFFIPLLCTLLMEGKGGSLDMINSYDFFLYKSSVLCGLLFFRY